jgi:hypothetical protein
MSDSNRGTKRFDIIAIVVTGIFGLGLLIGQTWYSGWRYGHGNIEAKSYADYYTQGTKEKIEKTCVSGSSFDLDCAIEQIKSTREAQHDAYDLQAQQDSSTWAYGSMWLTLTNNIATIIGIFFVWKSLSLNREAIKVANSANYTAVRAMEQERENSEEANRPWVTVTADNIQLFASASGMQASATITVKNIGPWPAEGVRICCMVSALNFFNGSMNLRDAEQKLHNIFDIWSSPKQDQWGDLTLFNGEPVTQNWSSSESMDAIELSMATNINRDAMIFVAVGASYWFRGKNRRTVVVAESSRTQFDFKNMNSADTTFTVRLSRAT